MYQNVQFLARVLDRAIANDASFWLFECQSVCHIPEPRLDDSRYGNVFCIVQ